MDCDEINCKYCNEQNDILNQPDSNNFIIVTKANITQGEKYNFNNPEEDPYDREIINSLISQKFMKFHLVKKAQFHREIKIIMRNYVLFV